MRLRVDAKGLEPLGIVLPRVHLRTQNVQIRNDGVGGGETSHSGMSYRCLTEMADIGAVGCTLPSTRYSLPWPLIDRLKRISLPSYSQTSVTDAVRSAQ